MLLALLLCAALRVAHAEPLWHFFVDGATPQCEPAPCTAAAIGNAEIGAGGAGVAVRGGRDRVRVSGVEVSKLRDGFTFAMVRVLVFFFTLFLR